MCGEEKACWNIQTKFDYWPNKKEEKRWTQYYDEFQHMASSMGPNLTLVWWPTYPFFVLGGPLYFNTPIEKQGGAAKNLEKKKLFVWIQS